jgi:hypothetical protein
MSTEIDVKAAYAYLAPAGYASAEFCTGLEKHHGLRPDILHIVRAYDPSLEFGSTGRHYKPDGHSRPLPHIVVIVKRDVARSLGIAH